MAKNKTPKTGLTKKHWVGYALGDMGGCMTFALMGSMVTRYYTNVLHVNTVVLAVLLAACIVVDMTLPTYHIAVTVIKKATVYALVAVSMNLLNGFTGLFSLVGMNGQTAEQHVLNVMLIYIQDLIAL